MCGHGTRLERGNLPGGGWEARRRSVRTGHESCDALGWVQRRRGLMHG
jgi:hypothetical protein